MLPAAEGLPVEIAHFRAGEAAEQVSVCVGSEKKLLVPDTQQGKVEIWFVT